MLVAMDTSGVNNVCKLSDSENVLQLNLSSPSADVRSKTVSKVHNSDKLYGKNQPIKQKTHIYKAKKETPRNNEQEVNKKSKDFKLLSTQKIQTSSLFKNNPDIPSIEIPRVTRKHESVFSRQTFEELNLHPHLVSCLQARMNIQTVTEVQSQTIPQLLQKKDALVKSCTGSGKTLAFAIPLIQQLQEIRPKIKRSDGVFALIIVPTRELALQCYESFSTLTKAFTWIVPGYLIGGEKKKSEKARIRKGISVLICTPGRLLDHLEHTANLDLKKIRWLVIDEADKLLEQGFEDAVLKILSHCSNNTDLKRQSVLLSATLTKGVEHLAGISLKDPVYIDISESDSGEMTDLVVPSQLKQHFIITPTKLRLVTLSAFVVEKCAIEQLKALIFMSTQAVVDFHYIIFRDVLKTMLKVKGHRIKVFRLHGNLKQEERTEIFNKFRRENCGILLCTDVAARGLDLPSVDWIVQYNAPVSPENYVHRVGRTARIGKKGYSLLFIVPSEIDLINLLQKHDLILEEMSMKALLQSLSHIADVIQEKSKLAQHARSIEEQATTLQLKYEDVIYSENSCYESAKNAFLSFVQAYASYPKALKDVIPFKMLHLGHVAKSFCLRESPSSLGCHYSCSKFKHQQKNSNLRDKTAKKRKHSAVVSEFDSGLNDWRAVIKDKTSKKRKHSAIVSEFDSGLNDWKALVSAKRRKK